MVVVVLHKRHVEARTKLVVVVHELACGHESAHVWRQNTQHACARRQWRGKRGVGSQVERVEAIGAQGVVAGEGNGHGLKAEAGAPERKVLPLVVKLHGNVHHVFHGLHVGAAGGQAGRAAGEEGTIKVLHTVSQGL